MITRRAFGAAAAAVAFTPRLTRAETPADKLAALESLIGGRIGFAALDTATGRRLDRRGQERFAMCSTFKWMLAAAVLAKVDAGRLALDQAVHFTATDVLPTSPVTQPCLNEGVIPLAALCEAIVEVSDNTAANLLLAQVGGPGGLTRFLRAHGDTVTRLDRREMELNSNLPGDPRDTSTPAAQVATMQRILLGDVLSPASRERLVGWMKQCRTGLARLRAGLPKDWVVADKTGTGVNGAVNDLAIAWPPGGKPIVMVAYLSGSSAPTERLEAAQAEIGRIVAAAFG